MPNAGMGPRPNIKIGSRMALMRPAAAINMLGVLVSPQARNMLLPVMIQTTIMLPGSQTTMYSLIAGISDSRAPIKLNMLSMKNQQIATTIVASSKEI